MTEALKTKLAAEAGKDEALKMWLGYLEQIMTPAAETAFVTKNLTLKGYFEKVRDYAKKNAKNSSFCGDDQLAARLLREYTGTQQEAAPAPAPAQSAGVTLDLLDLIG